MAKLFHVIPAIALALAAAKASAADVRCPAPVPVEDAASDSAPPPTAGQYHQAMQQAMASAERLDWVKDPNDDSPCQGYYRQAPNPDPDAGLAPDKAQTRLSAMDIEQNAQGLLQLRGNVEVYQGRRRLRCDAMLLDRQSRYSELNGNIQLREPGLLLLADSAVLDGEQEYATFTHAQYVLHDYNAHGRSQSIELKGGEASQLMLTDSSFSLCPPDNPDWSFSARSVEIDEDEGRGILRSAFFRLRDVPLLYLPWLDFPIDDRRKTGFLWPSISGGSDGLDIAVPWYLNLAPHYDMTYTPRFNNKHGLLHNLELRYKQRYSEWAVGGSYIYDDDEINGVQTDSDDTLDSQRWLGFVRQQGRFNEYWRSRIDYTSVSDIHYFRDWGTTGLDVRKSLNIRRSALLAFEHPDWLATAELVDYQNLEYDTTTGDVLEEAYRQLPVIDVSYRDRLQPFRLQPLLKARYSYFHHDSRLTGQRLYLNPGLSLPLIWQPASVIARGGVKQTHLALDSDNDASQAIQAAGEYNGSHSTSVPWFSLDNRLFLERDSMAGSRQLITPRLFYYYADYEAQDTLPNFDTDLLAFSYQQLWRETRFAGFDRIGDANRLSWGIDTQWVSRHGRTVFDVGIGQTRYFADRKVTAWPDNNTWLLIDGSESPAEARIERQTNELIDRDYYRDASDVAMQANWYMNDYHALQLDYLWDPYQKKSREFAIALHYRDDQQRLANLAWRLKRQPGAIADDGSYFDQRINQLDGSFYLPVNQQWHTYMRANYDLNREKIIETLVGIRYESCCWAVMAAWKRERKTFENNSRIADTARLDYQQSWLIQFELKGLGGVTDSIKSLLEESIRGYQ